MAKHWTEITDEAKHVVQETRRRFLLEHERADQIVVSSEGIPLQAIYFSPEMPGYGMKYTDVSCPNPIETAKDVSNGK